MARLPGRARAPPAALTGELLTQYNVALMTVKAHEDKTYRGAFIASLTLPWGFAVNADEGGGGYHFVWARDLYQQVSSLLAAGDRAAADRAVTWLFTHQQQADGTFPQNSHVDGSPDQRNIQLDETAFPIILAWQLSRTDDATWAGVRKAANALVARGPATPQERWEESGGYSGSTLPAMIAGLVTASDLARRRGDEDRARLWLGVADAWQRNLETWLFTTNGPLGDGRYYVRIDDDGDPNDGSERDFGNAAGVHKENEVVDGGILELVRLGVKAPGDPYVAASLPEIDASLATDTPSGRVWHRYTFDGYGEQPNGAPWVFNTPGTKGRAWPLLSGERGEYELANGRDGLPFLQTMANTANDGYMIPEQVWDENQPAPAAVRLPARQGDRLRLAAGVGDGPVRPPRPRDRRRQAGRDPRCRERPLRHRRHPRGSGAHRHLARERLARRRAHDHPHGHHRRRQGHRRQRRLRRHRHAERRHLQRPRHAPARPQPDHGRRRRRRRRHQHAPGHRRLLRHPRRRVRRPRRRRQRARAPTPTRPTPPSPRAASTSPA